MSFLLAISLLLQISALLLIYWRVRSRWLGYTGALFAFMLFVFHGLTEVVQSLFPGLNVYRTMVSQLDVDNWVSVVSVAIVIFAVVYSIRLRPVERDASGRATPSLQVLDWRLLLVLIVPGYLSILSGESSTQIGYWISGLTGQFLVFGLVLTALGLLVELGSKRTLPVILALAVATTLIGSRLTVLAAVAMLVTALLRYNLRVPARTLLVSGALVAVLAIVISAARVAVGRGTLSGSTADRIEGLLAGVQALPNLSRIGRDVAVTFVYRFDGNAINARIYREILGGAETTGLEPFWNNLFLAVPGFLNPDKLISDLTKRNEEVYMAVHYGLPLNIDTITSTFGTIFGYYGVLGLLIGAGLMGWGFAAADNWIQRRRTGPSVLAGLGLTYCAIFIEQGVSVYFISFRGLLVLSVLLLIAEEIRRVWRHSGRPPRTRPAAPYYGVGEGAGSR